MVDRISVLQEVRKFLSEAKEIFFHGTSSVLAKKILKQGFDPDPKQKVWSQDRGHLASFIGSYFTDNILTAVSAGRNAVEKFGGDIAFFAVQLETRTGLFDEDQVPEIQYFIQTSVLHLFNVRFVPSIAKSILQDKSELASITDDVAVRWLEFYNNTKRTGPKPDVGKPVLTSQLRQKLKPLLKEWALIFIEEMAKFDNYNYDTFYNYPNKNSKIRAIFSKVMDALRGELARTIYDYQKNIRIDSPVTFRGSNKILELVVIPKNYTSYDVLPITLVYGSGKHFINNLRHLTGSKYELTKGRL